MQASQTVGLVIGILIGLAIGFLYLQVWKIRYTREVRLDAVQRSQAVTTGKVSEQLVPHFPDFPFNPRDARFIGSPVDFVVFDGLTEGEVRRVVFVEVKTGNAELSPRERKVKGAITAGRVEWSDLRIAREERRVTGSRPSA